MVIAPETTMWSEVATEDAISDVKAEFSRARLDSSLTGGKNILPS